MKLRRAKVTALLFAAVAFLLAACGGGGNVQSVQIDSEGLRLVPGDSAELTVIVQSTGTVSEEVEWSSSDEAVATVDSDGVVTAVEVGEAEITAVSVADERRSDTVSVTVLALPSGAAEGPGGATATVGSEDVDAATAVSDGQYVVTVGDTGLQLGLLAGDGEALPVAAGGVPRVTADGSVSIQGDGYAPGSPVDVWFLSEPTLLGSVAADADGGFAATYSLPTGLETGLHTLIVEGLNQDDEALTLRVGIEVEEGAAITEFAHCPANADWYVSSERGDDEALGSTIAAPFATIQVAIDEAEERDVVCVAPGTYAVDNSGLGDGGATVVVARVDKPLTLIGPNTGTPGYAERGPEARVVTSSTEGDWLLGFMINSSDVTVDGFYITTDTPKPKPDRTSHLVVWGFYVSAGATENVTISNNRVVDTNNPIWVNRGRTDEAAFGFVVESNLIEGPRQVSDQAILVQGASGSVLDNVVRDTRVGLQVQPYHQGGAGVVAGNDIEAFQNGMWFNYLESPDGSWLFDGNEVLGVESPLGWPLGGEDPDHWSGIRIETFYTGEVTFTNNTVRAGEADPDTGDVYLLRQKNYREGLEGTVIGIGTVTDPGEFFTSNSFPDFGTAGITSDDLTEEGGLLQLVAPGE